MNIKKRALSTYNKSSRIHKTVKTKSMIVFLGALFFSLATLPLNASQPATSTPPNFPSSSVIISELVKQGQAGIDQATFISNANAAPCFQTVMQLDQLLNGANTRTASTDLTNLIEIMATFSTGANVSGPSLTQAINQYVHQFDTITDALSTDFNNMENYKKSTTGS